MRAMVVHKTGGPEVLELEDIPVPQPGEHEVTIDVRYAGVGLVDALFRDGTLPIPTPFVPGIEVTGQVREVGTGVTGFVPGEPVAALLNDFGRGNRAGGYAETVVAHETMTTALPHDANLPTVTGALINGVTAWMALRDLAAVQPTETVVVLGASGGLGGTAARLAALLPCRRVVGVVSRDVSRAPEQCTDVVLTGKLQEWLSVQENTVDVVIDPVGGDARRQLLGSLAPFRRHIILGDASGEDVELSTDGIWGSSASVIGLSLGSIAHLRADAVASALTAVVDLVVRGLLDEPHPDMRLLDEAVAVHRSLADRTAPAKTVLDASSRRT